jgi:hypothetical protein
LLPNCRGGVGMNSVCIAQTIVDYRAKRDETELNGTATTEFGDRSSNQIELHSCGAVVGAAS